MMRFLDYGRLAERLMGMDDEAWARHANPWSLWTRVPILPLAALAVFSRVWIGWWCLVPFVALVVWAWINPRAFSPPASNDHWAAEVTFGERIWLERKVAAIPAHHARAASALSAVSAAGALPALVGLIVLDGWMTAAGVAVSVLAKLWFCDRMVWLHKETLETAPARSR